jgi:hypothetical protein
VKEVGDPRHHTVPELPWKRHRAIRLVKTLRVRVIYPDELRFEKPESIIDSSHAEDKKPP